jgi:hypothetical protein
MRKFLLLLPVLAFCACNNPEEPKTAAVQGVEKRKAIYIPKVEAGFEGYYSGAFVAEGDEYLDARRITMRIDSVRRGIVYGWSIVAGNEQLFKGPLEKVEDGVVAFVGREPGTDAHDGSFRVRISGDSLRGTWTAFDKSLKQPLKNLALLRRSFRYNPENMLDHAVRGDFMEGSYDRKSDKAEALNEAVFTLNASAQALRPADLENLYKADLEVLRNTIYARHGYSFRNARMRAAFDHSVEWYVPVSSDVTALLTPLELKNIALIKRYEGHAEKYYDSFGR